MKYKAIIFPLLLFSISASAQETTASKQEDESLQRLFGLAYVPANKWSVYSLIGQEQWLKYKFSAEALTTYEATFSLRKFPLKFGVNAQVENNLIGKAYKFAGFIGIKKIMLRIQSGKISGTAQWTGSPIPDSPQSIPFNNKYIAIDLLYLPRKDGKDNMFYFGLGYTSLKMPVQVNTLITAGGKENQKYGVAVFDSLYSAKAYSFLFGFDLISSEARNPREFKGGLGAFAATQDKFGGGMCKVSEGAVKRAEAVNPGRKVTATNLFSALVEYNLSLGIKYSHRVGKGIIIGAVGYDFGGAMLADFNGAASTSKDLGVDPALFYWHHGFLFRIYAGW